MEWFSALFGTLWTSIAVAFVKWSWTAPDRWLEQGFIDNGLGTRITRKENPRSFQVAIWATKAFSCWAAALALGGGAMTIGWIWKAI
jgi:hypothetical protein